MCTFLLLRAMQRFNSLKKQLHLLGMAVMIHPVGGLASLPAQAGLLGQEWEFLRSKESNTIPSCL